MDDAAIECTLHTVIHAILTGECQHAGTGVSTVLKLKLPGPDGQTRVLDVNMERTPQGVAMYLAVWGRSVFSAAYTKFEYGYIKTSQGDIVGPYYRD